MTTTKYRNEILMENRHWKREEKKWRKNKDTNNNIENENIHICISIHALRCE